MGVFEYKDQEPKKQEVAPEKKVKIKDKPVEVVEKPEEKVKAKDKPSAPFRNAFNSGGIVPKRG